MKGKEALVVVHFGEMWLKDFLVRGGLSSLNYAKLIEGISQKAQEIRSRFGEVIYLPITPKEQFAPSFLPSETHFIQTPAELFYRSFLSYQIVRTRERLAQEKVSSIKICGAWRWMCVNATEEALKTPLSCDCPENSRIGWGQHREYFSPLLDHELASICGKIYQTEVIEELCWSLPSSQLPEKSGTMQL